MITPGVMVSRASFSAPIGTYTDFLFEQGYFMSGFDWNGSEGLVVAADIAATFTIDQAVGYTGFGFRSSQLSVVTESFELWTDISEDGTNKLILSFVYDEWNYTTLDEIEGIIHDGVVISLSCIGDAIRIYVDGNEVMFIGIPTYDTNNRIYMFSDDYDKVHDLNLWY